MPEPAQRLLKMPSTLYIRMISRVTSVMNSKLYGPRQHVTHNSGSAQCLRFLPSALTAIQSGCAS